MSDILTIALSKGRILEQTLPLLAYANLTPLEDVQTTRKLMVDGPVIEGVQVRFLIIRAADVCTYVEQGAADMGISGRDLLLEHRPYVYEPLDLNIGCCRVCICGLKDAVKQGEPQAGSRIRVATKYDALAEAYYLSQGIQAEIIHLYGGMELAPLVGMAERIVDIDSDIVVNKGIIYVASYQGRVSALSMDSGRPLWSRELSSYAGLAADDNALYVSDADDKVWALDLGTGASLWTQEKLQRRSITGPVLHGDYVVVADFDGYIHWLSKIDGAFVSRRRVAGKGVLSTPTVVDDTLFVLGKNGSIHAVQLHSPS